MNCHAAQRLLSAERDGPLSTTEQADLAAHVADCEECRRARSLVAATVENWRSAHTQFATPDPERAWQDIRREIRTTAPAGGAGLRSIPRWVLPVTAAAALLLAATLGPRWLGDSAAPTTARAQVARADFVETAADASSMVYVDDRSGWLVVWSVSDQDKL